MRSTSVFTPNTLNPFPSAFTTIGRKIYKSNREIGNDKRERKTQTNSRFYTDAIEKDGNSYHRILDQNISRSVHSLSSSLNLAALSEHRNGHGHSELIPLNQTLTTQRPLRPESEKKRPISGNSYGNASRPLSQSHSSIQELRRGVSCSSVISTESNASCDTVSMEPNGDSGRPATAEVLTTSKPPPLPAKSVRTTHTDLTTSDYESTFGSPLQKKPLPSLHDLQPPNKPKPRPRMTKFNEDVYKNINSIRRNDE